MKRQNRREKVLSQKKTRKTNTTDCIWNNKKTKDTKFNRIIKQSSSCLFFSWICIWFECKQIVCIHFVHQVLFPLNFCILFFVVKRIPQWLERQKEREGERHGKKEVYKSVADKYKRDYETFWLLFPSYARSSFLRSSSWDCLLCTILLGILPLLLFLCNPFMDRLL